MKKSYISLCIKQYFLSALAIGLPLTGLATETESQNFDSRFNEMKNQIFELEKATVYSKNEVLNEINSPIQFNYLESHKYIINADYTDNNRGLLYVAQDLGSPSKSSALNITNNNNIDLLLGVGFSWNYLYHLNLAIIKNNGTFNRAGLNAKYAYVNNVEEINDLVIDGGDSYDGTSVVIDNEKRIGNIYLDGKGNEGLNIPDEKLNDTVAVINRAGAQIDQLRSDYSNIYLKNEGTINGLFLDPLNNLDVINTGNITDAYISVATYEGSDPPSSRRLSFTHSGHIENNLTLYNTCTDLDANSLNEGNQDCQFVSNLSNGTVGKNINVYGSKNVIVLNEKTKVGGYIKVDNSYTKYIDNTLKLVAEEGKSSDLSSKDIRGFDRLIVEGNWKLPNISDFAESITIERGDLRLFNGTVISKNLSNKENSRIVVESDYTIEGNLTNRNEVVFEPVNSSFTPSHLTVKGDYNAEGEAVLKIRADISVIPEAIDQVSIEGNVTGITKVELVPVREGALEHSLKGKAKVIETGHSDENAFVLAKNQFGKYKYRLSAIAEDSKVNWYLSQFTNANLGNFTNALASTQDMFNLSYYDRNAAQQTANNQPIWLRVSHSHYKNELEQDPVVIKSKRQVLQLGYHAGNQALANGQLSYGAYLNYGVEKTKAHNEQEESSQSSKLTGYGVTLYANWENDKFYVDSWLSHQQFKLDINGDESSSHKMKSWQASLELGYRHLLVNTTHGSLWLQPQWQVRYHQLNTPELENTQFLGTENILQRAGLRLSLLSDNSRIQPYMEVNWLYQKNKNGLNVDGDVAYLAGRSATEVKLGIQSWKVASNLSLWTQTSHQFARKYKNTAVNVGLRYEF